MSCLGLFASEKGLNSSVSAKTLITEHSQDISEATFFLLIIGTHTMTACVAVLWLLTG